MTNPPAVGVGAPPDRAPGDPWAPAPSVSPPSTQAGLGRGRPGQCPGCGARVLWAEVPTPEPTDDASWQRRVLLAPQPIPAASEGHGLPAVRRGTVAVMFSPAGRAMVVSPVVYALHVCSPDRVLGTTGAYTAVVLARPCPVEFCLAMPGRFCTTPRQEILVRPHGLRVAAVEELAPDAPAPSLDGEPPAG